MYGSEKVNRPFILGKPDVIQSATQIGVTYARGQPNGIF